VVVEILNAGEVISYLLLDIALILIAARLVGGIFVRFNQPRVVGEIVAGILLGPTLLGSTSGELFPPQSVSALNGIGQLGLLLFSFLVGLELEMVPLRQNLRSVLTIGISVVAVPVAVGFMLAPVLSNQTFQVDGASEPGFLLFVGAILAVTALPVMVRILQEKRLTLSRIGAVGIAAASVCTVAMFVTSSLAVSLSRNESGTRIVLKLLLIAVFLCGMALIGRPLAGYMTRPFRSKGIIDSGVYAWILIFVIIAGFLAHQLGLTVIVGGFMAGLVFPRRKPLFKEMNSALGDLTATILLPIFLAVSGIATDFRKLTVVAIPGLLILLVAAVTSKWTSGAAAARFSGISWRDGNVIGILMNCRGLMVLVVAMAGVQNGVITPALQLGAVLIALLTTAMTGPLFKKFYREGAEQAPALEI
jgi:K+:H+ antiporter